MVLAPALGQTGERSQHTRKDGFWVFPSDLKMFSSRKMDDIATKT